MRKVYIVMSGRYVKTPVIVTYEKSDAITLATSINTNSLEEISIDDYICEVPILDNPESFDVNDLLSTAIYGMQKGYEYKQLSLFEDEE